MVLFPENMKQGCKLEKKNSCFVLKAMHVNQPTVNCLHLFPLRLQINKLIKTTTETNKNPAKKKVCKISTNLFYKYLMLLFKKLFKLFQHFLLSIFSIIFYKNIR